MCFSYVVIVLCFKNVEDAEKCLQAGTELTLKGNVLDCHKALNKNELEMKRNAQKVVKQKDTRNLYLVKEGGEFYLLHIILV